jgi:hypothetical protein
MTLADLEPMAELGPTTHRSDTTVFRSIDRSLPKKPVALC